MKTFIAGCIGGACGALVAGITGIGATAYGVTGLFGFLITTDYTFQYLLVIVVASVVAFVISWILFKESTPAKEKQIMQSDTEKNTVYSPMSGKVVPLSQVSDSTFAGEVLGKGMAVVPETGRIVAPFDGRIENVFDTKHAIGLVSRDGVEVLIHVGINTVELGGEFYESYVSDGEEVKLGQLLLTFDIKKIKEAGYDITTPVIVTNTDDYQEVTMVKQGTIKEAEKAMVVR